MKIGAWYKRLSIQLVALLTLALLPLGSIALFQTSRVAAEADRTAGLAVLGMTERAARAEQLLIERAVGAARLFGSIAPDLLNNPTACERNLSRFVDANPDYSFIGVLPLSGIVECSSTSGPIDFTTYSGFAAAMEAQQATIVVDSEGPSTGLSVFVVSEPYNIDGEFAGFISVSIPHAGLPETSDQLTELGLEELITFNDAGTILTSRSTLDQAAREMPSGALLSGLSTSEPQTFRAPNLDGIERRYSIVTIEGSPAAVMAVWRIDGNVAGQSTLSVAPVIFPVLMWLASMGVAMLSMNTLVLRHLRRMRLKMERFAENRATHDTPADHVMMPTEIENLEKNFSDMTDEILRDEASLENAVREKDVLVKEIHHRVKNNLQLISSIMNMQIRSAEHEETKTVLRRVQDRVLSLATIHRDLYQSQEGGRVNASALVKEIVEKSTELVTVDGATLEVVTELEPVMLYPDQAVPLSLLVAEATTNAMKYLGDQTSSATPTIDVRLTQDDRACVLVMSNSVGIAPEAESTGLGSKLMNAFAMQLGGQIDVEQSDTVYTLTLSFNALEFEPEARDF